MKNSKICPKCQSVNIARIEGYSGMYGAGNNIAVGLSIFSAIKVTRFLCVDCGFSEEWVESRGDLETIKKKKKYGVYKEVKKSNQAIDQS